jgi:uncharacterized DUF497 family protein
VRFHFDERKSKWLGANPKRGIGFEEVQGVREDDEGEYYHLITLWKATKHEREIYEEHS